MKCQGKRLRDGLPCRNNCLKDYNLCHIHMNTTQDNARKIQKTWRNRIWRQKMGVRNRTDFASLDSVLFIEPKDWFCWYCPQSSCYYGCDKQSMKDWLEKSSKNPYTNDDFSERELKQIKRKLELTELSNRVNWENGSLFDMIVYLCTCLEDTDNYTNPQWFLNLQNHEWLDWIEELDDMIQRTSEQQLVQMNVHTLSSFHDLWFLFGDTIEDKKKQVISGCIQLIISSQSLEDRKLGATWVLQTLGRIIEGIPGTSPGESEVNSPRWDSQVINILWEHIHFHLRRHQRF